METGAITQYIDVAQVVLYLFWLFFVGLILYLRREDKREGYPLVSDRTNRTSRVQVVGYPEMPDPKAFTLHDGSTVMAPSGKAESGDIKARPIGAWPGAPLEPTGNPMLDGVGPGSYAQRADVPDMTLEGTPKIVPLRTAPDYGLEERSPDPRGMKVVGADGAIGGTVCDVWVDKSEPQVRFLEVEVSHGSGNRKALLPIGLAKVNAWRKEIHVHSILGRQFADVPGLKHPDQVTLLEEEKIYGYYGGGKLYATPGRLGPWL